MLFSQICLSSFRKRTRWLVTLDLAYISMVPDVMMKGQSLLCASSNSWQPGSRQPSRYLRPGKIGGQRDHFICRLVQVSVQPVIFSVEPYLVVTFISPTGGLGTETCRDTPTPGIDLG